MLRILLETYDIFMTSALGRYTYREDDGMNMKV